MSACQNPSRKSIIHDVRTCLCIATLKSIFCRHPFLANLKKTFMQKYFRVPNKQLFRGLFAKIVLFLYVGLLRGLDANFPTDRLPTILKFKSIFPSPPSSSLMHVLFLSCSLVLSSLHLLSSPKAGDGWQVVSGTSATVIQWIQCRPPRRADTAPVAPWWSDPAAAAPYLPWWGGLTAASATTSAVGRDDGDGLKVVSGGADTPLASGAARPRQRRQQQRWAATASMGRI